MTTKICNPLAARWWFKYGIHMNFVYVLIGFIVFIFALQHFFYPLGVDVVAVGLAYVVFFYVLGKPAIAIECPNLKCGKYIETNTPWKCGNPKCQKDNEQVEKFPFVYHCQHCGVEPKAYKCHHCGEIIFLGKDRLETICATLVRPPEKIKPKPFKKNPVADKIDQENESIRRTEFELRKAKLDLQLKVAKKELEPEKKMTEEEKLEEDAKEFEDREMSGAKIVARWKARNAVLFKDDPIELEKADARADKWATKHLVKM